MEDKLHALLSDLVVLYRRELVLAGYAGGDIKLRREARAEGLGIAIAQLEELLAQELEAEGQVV